MLINELSQDECGAFLARVPLARLGSALDNQPYVVPVYFAYEQNYVCVFSTFGQKIEWMRVNPKVCLQADEIQSQAEWTSVVVTGTYQELPEPRYTDEREHARKLLEKRYHWWQNALG